MSRFLLINGPNLNFLGRRDPDLYGTTTLPDIEQRLTEKAANLGHDIACFQSNSEGAIVDFIQQNWQRNRGIIINPGALTHYGYSLRDALSDANVARHRSPHQQHPRPRGLPRPLSDCPRSPRPDCRFRMARIPLSPRLAGSPQPRRLAAAPPCYNPRECWPSGTPFSWEEAA